MTKKPSYRFVVYTEPWEQRKLGDVSTITMGQSPNSENYTDNPNDSILVQGNADMKNGRVFPRVWTTQITKQARQGDLILSVRAPVGDIGKTDYDVVLGRGVASIDGNEFLYQALSQMKQNGYWSKLSTGSTFESINSNDIKSAIISLPSLPEQTAIGSFFQDIDQLISLQQRKLEVLKEQKKTYLKLLFPSKGQTKPALRFAGFEDEWTSALLGDISELYQPKTISSEELLTEGFPVFGANGYIGYYKDYNHKEDQVTISARGEGTGTPSFVEGPVWITGNSMVVNVEKQANIIKLFLYAFCLSFNFKPFVTGGAQPQLTREVLKKVNIMLPSLPEQEAIGSFFQDLDKAIAKQEEKVNQLKESKQTFLKKMFI